MPSTQIAPVRLDYLALRNRPLIITLVVALSANTSDAQIMTRVGSEWKTISTLTEVCKHMRHRPQFALVLIRFRRSSVYSTTSLSLQLIGLLIRIASLLARTIVMPMSGLKSPTLPPAKSSGNPLSLSSGSTAQPPVSVGLPTRTSSQSHLVLAMSASAPSMTRLSGGPPNSSRNLFEAPC
jgi:hypothetical protein